MVLDVECWVLDDILKNSKLIQNPSSKTQNPYGIEFVQAIKRPYLCKSYGF
jgi:hypothetical protein